MLIFWLLLTISVWAAGLKHCVITQVGAGQNYTYVETILKKVIAEAELSSDIVIDELYEEFGQCMLSKTVCEPNFFSESQ